MKKICTLLLFFIYIAVNAQQLNLISQYTENQSIINPAAMSIDYLKYNQRHSTGINYRYQWAGIEDAPQTAFARFEYIQEGNNLAVLGATLIQDRVGATSQTGLLGRYAYQLRPSIGADILIGVGLSFGIVQYRIDASKLDFDPNDQLSGNTPKSYVPDLSIGANIIYYPEYGTKWYAGIAIPQTVGLDVNFTTDSDKNLSIKRMRHFYATGGAIIAIGQQGFLEPSIWIKKTADLPLHIDLNIRQKFANNFWVGMGYSTAKSLKLDTGILLNQLIGLNDSLLRIGYAFEYNISQYGQYLGTTHEIGVSFSWN